MALIKCPDCGKDISDLAAVCINCGRPINSISHDLQQNQPIRPTTPPRGSSTSFNDFQAKLIVDKCPIEVKGLRIENFENDHFEYEGKQYAYNTVISLFHVSQSVTVNFITTSSAEIKIKFANDTIIKISSGGFQKKSRKKIDDAFFIIRIKTGSSRAKFYRDQLLKNGFIDYHYLSKISEGGAFSTIGIPSSIRIYSNGFIEKGEKRYNLRVAKESGILIFGAHWEFGLNKSYDPAQIIISEKKIKLLPAMRTLRINAIWDTDIIHSLIQAFADGRELVR